VRIARLRRALLGAGIAAALIMSLMVLRSWIGNRGYIARTTAATSGVAALPTVNAPPGTIALPSVDALQRLDALRALLDTLEDFDEHGVPSKLRWGLWKGRAVLADARRVWLAGYERELHRAAWTALVDSLRALPANPRPSDNYGRNYAMLRTYLIGTTESRRSTPELVAPVLLASFARGQTLGAEVTTLARRQFEYYASLLSKDNPFPKAADAVVVGRAREFLRHSIGPDQIYQYMLAEASRAAPPARLDAIAPQTTGFVTAPEVPGAFTERGGRFMQDAFAHADPYFEGESWVVGDVARTNIAGRDSILAQLRARYRADYVRAWTNYIGALSVSRASSARDAAAKLGVLGSGQSPLLAALTLIARNANVDSVVSAALQPARVVTSPKADT
jgi:type VI secretion system protein ImpL